MPCERRERRSCRARAGTGRDRVEVEVELDSSRVLRRGLWRVRREAKVGKEYPSMDTSHRSGGLDIS